MSRNVETCLTLRKNRAAILEGSWAHTLSHHRFSIGEAPREKRRSAPNKAARGFREGANREGEGGERIGNMRRVIDGETVSGHGKAPNFPELLVVDGIGPGDGRLICSIESFHEASVTLRPDGTTELLIGHMEAHQTPVGLTITNGIVLYDDGRAA